MDHGIEEQRRIIDLLKSLPSLVSKSSPTCALRQRYPTADSTIQTGAKSRIKAHALRRITIT